MFIARKAISRRTVLRGVGAAVALPLLDSMVPALTAIAKAATKPVNRFGLVYVPNGMIMKNYLPVVEGTGFELTPTLGALAPFRDQMLVLSGLNSTPTPGRPGGAHAKASTRFLTDVSPPTSETWLDAGISMDQILAQETGKHTQLAIARAGDRIRPDRRRVRHRLRLCVHQHAFMGQLEHPAANAERSARGLRAVVRRQRQYRSEGPAGSSAAAAERAGCRRSGNHAPSGFAAAARSREARRISGIDSRR